MCIRDRRFVGDARPLLDERGIDAGPLKRGRNIGSGAHAQPCLLYTSDAADERSSVDLGGRRIIKKQKQIDK